MRQLAARHARQGSPPRPFHRHRFIKGFRSGVWAAIAPEETRAASASVSRLPKSTMFSCCSITQQYTCVSASKE